MVGTKGVEPGMKLQPTFVGFLDGKSKWVIAGVFALVAGEIDRPRLDRGAIEGITSGAHLKDNCIQMKLHRLVKDSNQFGLLLFCREATARWPVYIVHSGHPYSAELARNRRHFHRGRGLLG